VHDIRTEKWKGTECLEKKRKKIIVELNPCLQSLLKEGLGRGVHTRLEVFDDNAHE
jgi:hypothetical protein